MTPRDWGLTCAAIALALDQGSKLLLLYVFRFIELCAPNVAVCPPRGGVAVLPFFDLVMLWNPGVSYGLFAAHGPVEAAILVICSLVAVAALTLWLWTAERRILAMGLGLVIGGALGNLIDRLIYQKVADFFHFYVRGYDWYVFNVADCAITVGVIALLYDALLRPGSEAVGSDG
jgi:signal peptidase II